MWFSDEARHWLGQGVPLLAVSCVALVATIHVWAVRGRAPWWLRFGTLAAVALLLISLRATDPLLFVEGHLIAVLAISAASGDWRNQTTSRKPEFLAFAALLALDTVFALFQIDLLYPWRWFCIGLGAGLGAMIIDFGMRRRPWWFLWAIATCAIAIVVSCAIAVGVSNRDLFGSYLKYGQPVPEPWERSWDSHSVWLLGPGTFFYWLWRLTGRLATTDCDTPLVLTPSILNLQLWWSSLGKGFRRVLRLVIVWPVLLALSVFLFTPFLEAYYRLPPRASIPPPLEGPNGFSALVAFSDKLDWSMTESRQISEMSTAAGEPFYQANRQKILELEEVLALPSFPAIDYAPLAMPMIAEERDAIIASMTALFMIHTRAMIDFDFREQYDAARLMLLLSRPFRKNTLMRYSVLGREIESLGLMMAYESRDRLNAEQCQNLITILNASVAWEDSIEELLVRNYNWLLAIRGWREGVERACYPPWFKDSSLEYFEKEHQALRATLICELALRNYARDHDDEYPESLDELVPKYLSAIPIDPFNGSKVQYQVSTTPPLLPFTYCVGLNGKPEEGVPWDLEKVTYDKPDDISITHYDLETWK